VTLTAPAIRLIGRHRRVFKFVYLLKRIYLLTYLLTYLLILDIKYLWYT